MKFSNKLITILGPTAVGKTKFAAQLAYHFDGEIISADSRQVYIGMDIGTGKDYEDYIINDKKIPSHLLDLVKPHCEFNLYLFTQLFKRSYKEILEKEKLPFLVGGTGMYLSSVLQKYTLQKVDFNSPRAKELTTLNVDELINILQKTSHKLHNTTDLIEKERIIRAILIAEENEDEPEENLEIDHLVFGLFNEREIIKERIKNRLKIRLKSGMIEEVEQLLSSGITHEKLNFFGLEYKFISLYLKGELNFNDMNQKLASAIIQFSKRQMTWFRKMEKDGVKINWLKNADIEKAEILISNFIS
ncbi:MAG: tRNA (adenosine(37)-N6)-dimethylallyltransferase MiaA [Ignavibacteriae bacterium]|nr:tRNA (adenosine(37)-N6)-dimethylallyltransferase MiaA [Ignavibacteriota bacterium]